MNASGYRSNGFTPHRLVWHLGSYMELISFPWDDERIDVPLINIREPGNPTTLRKDISVKTLTLANAYCNDCQRTFTPSVTGDHQQTCIVCSICEAVYYFRNGLKDEDQETQLMLLPRDAHLPQNLQRIMEAIYNGWLQPLKLHMDDDGSGSIVRDDSAGRRGDVCYIEVIQWKHWQGFAALLTNESTEHIIKVLANPGRLPSGWIYRSGEKTARFGSYGEPELVEDGETWKRVRPVNSQEIDWYGR
jgi:hypothetical protein